MTEEKDKGKVSVFKALGQGGVYFGKNLHWIILFYAPIIAVLVFQFGNMFNMDEAQMANNMSDMLTPSYFAIMGSMSIFGLYVFGLLLLIMLTKKYVLGAQVGNIFAKSFMILPGMFLLLTTFSVSIGFASMLLIIPGIIVSVRWMFAFPIYAVNGGVVKSLEESAKLTKGYRWKIFAMIVIYFVLVIAASLIMGLVAFFSPAAVMGIMYGFVFLVVLYIGMAMLSLYKQMIEAKEFEIDNNRKGQSGFLKFLTVFSFIIAVGYMVFFAIGMKPMMENIEKMQQMQQQIQQQQMHQK